MKPTTTNELRTAFLEFFRGKGHQILPGASLVPHEDPTLLWINSGVATLKPYFSGQINPENPRMVSSQKSIRTNDIENVGRTARHHTLFEMLGNFSVGDYFKVEAIKWAWEFSTEVVGFDPQHIHVSVHPEDDEAVAIWRDQIGLPMERIVKLEDNFWDIGPGPCGPNSELFYDRGPSYGCGSDECRPGCDCDRYLEYWNLVFSQFNHQEDGTYVPLPRKNIDTGMGLERLASLVQDTETNFGTDLFMPYINHVEKLTGRTYKSDSGETMAFNVIADHVRAVTFAIGDGAAPSNEGRGYVIRRLLRRAVRYGRELGLNEPFLWEMVPLVAQVMAVPYPELTPKIDYISRIVRVEEERFLETIDGGTQLLAGVIAQLQGRGEKVIDGRTAFKLYDTFGFPLDLTDDIAREAGFTVDRDGFAASMQEQRVRARAARAGVEGDFGKANQFVGLAPTTFCGYDCHQTSSQVVGLLRDGRPVQRLESGEEGSVLLSETPFYAESGGQIGDSGILKYKDGGFQVETTVKYFGDLSLHKGTVQGAPLTMGQEVEALVDENRRSAIARAHTATHLLHAALRKVLGEHAAQAGSLVEPDRLRFDFSHFAPLTEEELNKVETMVNAEILAGHGVQSEVLSMEEAKGRGAIALFGEKYGDSVRVVSMGDFSMELCGGTHLHSSSQIGQLLLTTETGIGAGLRRIEAVTGTMAYRRAKDREAMLANIAEQLKTTIDEAPRRLGVILAELKEAERHAAKLHTRLMVLEAGNFVSKAAMVGDIPVVARQVDVSDMDSLRTAADAVRDKMPSGVLVLGAAHDDKVSLVAAVSDDLVKRGLHAGNLIREVAKLTGGGGGGRPNMAQAGGKDPAKLPEALDQVVSLVKQQLKI